MATRVRDGQEAAQPSSESHQVASQIGSLDLMGGRRQERKPLGVYALDELRKRLPGEKALASSSAEAIDRAAADVKMLYSAYDPEQREYVDYQLGEVGRVMKRLISGGDGSVAGEIDAAMAGSRNMNDLRLKLGAISLERNPEALRLLAEMDGQIRKNRESSASRKNQSSQPAGVLERVLGRVNRREKVHAEAVGVPEKAAVDGFREAFAGLDDLESARSKDIDAAASKVKSFPSVVAGGGAVLSKVEDVAESMKSLLGGGPDKKAAEGVYRGLRGARTLDDLMLVLLGLRLEQDEASAEALARFTGLPAARRREPGRGRRQAA